MPFNWHFSYRFVNVIPPSYGCVIFCYIFSANDLSCLSGDSNYHRVGERCIYFDKSPSTYAEARTRCKSTFGGKGKMYEPRNFEESINIGVEGYNKLSQDDWWIGVNDINEEGKFVFDSDGSTIPFTPTWNNQNSNNKDCVLVFTVPKKWFTGSCTNNQQMGTLCEYGELR